MPLLGGGLLGSPHGDNLDCIMKDYVLITGATGLLGRYLLRDLTLADARLAVLVRPARKASAWQRVENVMCYWEKDLGRQLPRPVVLEGEITEPDLGLDSRGIRWVAENCGRFLHNAASLTFESTSPTGEPWRSNIEGTRNVLELCRHAGIRQFHHVSTAYVCGLRQGLILESDVDVGQTLSNDYEKSKLQSELSVRNAPFLDQVTVYRPAIIVGDSVTGHTTTYHGFYAPLQAVAAISIAAERTPTGNINESSRFPLSGHETKNLVPVDWVSALMTHVFTHPENHGQTYHLTPRHPVTSRLLADVIEETMGLYRVRFEGGGRSLVGLTENEALFAQLIQVYASYWKDDPIFDTTNTDRAAPHLPCPHMNRKVLLMMARHAVSINFTSPRDRPVVPVFDTPAWLEPLCEAHHAAQPSPEPKIALRVVGHGGGDWTLAFSGGRLVTATPGLPERGSPLIETSVDTLLQLREGTVGVPAALAAGQIRPLQGLAPSRAQQIVDDLLVVTSEAQHLRA
jgi:thioester reductase-like protein